MKRIKNIILIIIAIVSCAFVVGCDKNSTTVKNSQTDILDTINIGNKLVSNQPTPTDIDYSLERYNLIRRAYWVNGQREKAMSYPCEITKPLGYIVLFSSSGAVIGRFVVDGKVSSLNSYLTPDSEYYEKNGSYGNTKSYTNKWLPDVDGSYGTNDSNGIFFFTTDGKYIEWTGDYLYSDIPFSVKDPILQVEGE